MDVFGFLNGLFGGNGGGGYTSTQGGVPLDKGFGAVSNWMVSEAFGKYGPLGQYLGSLYCSPGTGLSNLEWESRQELRRSGVSSISTPYGNVTDYGDFLDFPGTSGAIYEPSANVASSNFGATSSQSADSRSLEGFDRGESDLATPSGPFFEVTVNGFKPDKPRLPMDRWSEPPARLPMGEMQIWNNPVQLSVPQKPSQRTSRPPVRKPPPSVTTDFPPQQELPGSDTASSLREDTHSWASDVFVPEQYIPLDRLNSREERPERQAPSQWERTYPGRIETVPTVPTASADRSFWSRGGAGLLGGVATGSLGVAAMLWWNPVGWAAGLVGASAALAIAAGVTATTASTIQLVDSYVDDTTPEQDALMNRAISATLVYSSIGGVLGGVAGTVAADDAQVGFLEWGTYGGLAEGGVNIATSLPTALRSIPGIWRAAQPWGKSILLTPLSFFMTAGAGGGSSARALARIFAAQRRMAASVRAVEYLGTTQLLENEANWARYQVFATRTRQEAVFRITYDDGRQTIVLADKYSFARRQTLEAKYGDMGQMFMPEREIHIMAQAHNNLVIARAFQSDVGYVVSTERGANRLAQRFAREFPKEMASGQLWIEWVPW